MIKLKNVTKSYGDKIVVSDFNYNFKEGKNYFIMGKSGIGKTTLLRLISQIEVPTKGTVKYDNELKKAFLFQENRLLPTLTAEDNIKFVNKTANTYEIFKTVGLERCEKLLPSQMSGGMKRRLSLARALSANADCFFLDEPTYSLDEETRLTVLEILKRELKNKTAFIVTHSLEEAEMLADEIIYI